MHLRALNLPTVSHASELALLFGPVPDAVELDFANTYLDFYLNFINDLNPGCAQHDLTGLAFFPN